MTKTELAYDEDLGRGLRRARLAAEIGFREAARKTGLNITTIWRIEQGLQSPGMKTLLVMANLYNANLNVASDGIMLTWLEEPTDAAV